MFNDDIQPFAQYQYGELDGDVDNLSIATVGANYFINPNVRFSTDFGWSFGGIAAGWATGLTGWEHSDDNGQYLVRAQFQIVF